MNTISKWVLRTAALWAISKALQLANDSLKNRQAARRGTGGRAARAGRAVPTVNPPPGSIPL
jgi:hypothetical protein